VRKLATESIHFRQTETPSGPYRKNEGAAFLCAGGLSYSAWSSRMRWTSLTIGTGLPILPNLLVLWTLRTCGEHSILNRRGGPDRAYEHRAILSTGSRRSDAPANSRVGSRDR